MRRLIGLTLALAITFVFIFSGCGTQEAPAPVESIAPSPSATTETIEPSAVSEPSAPTAQDDEQTRTEESTTNNSIPAPTESTTQSPSDKNKSAEPNNTDKNTVILTIGDSTFSVALYDNNTAAALRKLLPLSVNMSELHGNEKYYYLPNSLPTNSEIVGSIEAGDLMLYGSDCLVLFYDNFSTSYSYTRLGYIEDVTGLKDALGSGSVQIKIK